MRTKRQAKTSLYLKHAFWWLSCLVRLIFRQIVSCHGVLFPVVLVANAGLGIGPFRNMGPSKSFFLWIKLIILEMFRIGSKPVFLPDKTWGEIRAKLFSPTHDVAAQVAKQPTSTSTTGINAYGFRSHISPTKFVQSRSCCFNTVAPSTKPLLKLTESLYSVLYWDNLRYDMSRKYKTLLDCSNFLSSNRKNSAQNMCKTYPFHIEHRSSDCGAHFLNRSHRHIPCCLNLA